MFKILLIITVMVAIFCLCVAIVAIFAAFRENELPDIEDVEFNLIIEERGSFSIE
jgi:hypothetical protein